MKRLISGHYISWSAGFEPVKRLSSACVIIFAGIMLAGCLRNEFEIRIELPKDITSTYRVSYYASDRKGGIMMEAAVAVAAGKGELKCVTRNPAVVSIYYGQSAIPSCVVFAERGDGINLKGSDDDPLGWEAGGNKVNKTLTEWRLANKDLLDSVISAPRDSESVGPRKSLNAAISKFIDGNESSVASLILLGIYFDSTVDTKEFKRLCGVLEKEGVMEKYPNLIARHDMLTATELIPSDGAGTVLKDIIVKSHIKNIDTLRIKSGEAATLMYFWRRSDLQRREDIDSLKRLAAWRGDSAALTIADFCLDSDSTSWAYPVQSDTLRHTVRAWAARGVADPDMMQMGVGCTPWWIVTSRGGKIVYAGSDREEALKKARSLRRR